MRWLLLIPLLSSTAFAQADTASRAVDELNLLLSLREMSLTYDAATGTITHFDLGTGEARFLGADVEVVKATPVVRVRCRGGAECIEVTTRDLLSSKSRSTDAVIFRAPGDGTPGNDEWAIDQVASQLGVLVGQATLRAEHSGAERRGGPHGSGGSQTLTLPGGAEYTGETRGGLPHGQGSVTYANGNRYTGSWAYGQINGHGTVTFPSGNSYTGNWVDERLDGGGRIDYANGEVYEGQLVDWKREGTGTLTIPDGGIYEGEWHDDNAHGIGRTTLVDGSFSEGTYVDGRLHGPGRFVDTGGTTFVGTYTEGQMDEGVLTVPGQAPQRVRWNGERLETIGPPDSPAPAPAPRPAPVAPRPAPARSAVDGSAPPSPPAFGAYQAAIARAQTPDAHRDAFVAYAGAMTAAGVGAERIQAELARQLEALLRFDFDSGFAAYIYIPTDHFVGVRERIDRTLNRCVLQRTRWTTASYVARQEGRTPDPRPVTECEGGTPPPPSPPPPAAPPAPRPPAPGCGALVVDLDRGTMNGVAPTATRAAIKTQFPCATGETEEGGPYNFGGGIFFINHDFYFYTHRDFLELRREFRGTTQPALLGRPLASSGLPAPTRTDQGARLYDKGYGCLRVETDDAGVITDLGVHATPCATLVVPR